MRCRHWPIAVRSRRGWQWQPAGLPAEVETAVYYICAEALANISKHASATTASIYVARRYGRLTVTVRDDGAGGADQSQGSGLRGLADRVEALGGRLAIESVPRAGTTLTADIPLDARLTGDSVRPGPRPG